MNIDSRPRLRCITVDDEPLAREGIEKYISQIDYLESKGTASNPVELASVLEHESIDLIFLDIRMPLISGIDFLKMSSNLPMVIVTTAYPSYAIEGFNLDVIDYLLKPISFNRFFKAVGKAKEYHQLLSRQGRGEHKFQEDEDFFFVKCNGIYERIYFGQILFIEAMQNYVNIYTEDGKYTTLLFLKSVENSLPKEQFLRVHRSYILAPGKVDRIDLGEAVIGNHRIPISRAHKAIAHERILKKLLR